MTAHIVGLWGEEEPRMPWLRFGEDGSLHGSDGCNELRGTYEVEDDRLVVSLGFHTLRACLGVDTWLAGIASAIVEGEILTVHDRAGREVGTLERRA